MKPLWIVCEDGTEYLERFARFLGGEFRFALAQDAGALLAVAEGADGLILDLDFRLTPPHRLVDEQGVAHDVGPEEVRRRLAATQGILLLRLLRARGVSVRVLLCADLEAEQASYLVQSLGPLEIVPSHEGLARTAERMRPAS